MFTGFFFPGSYVGGRTSGLNDISQFTSTYIVHSYAYVDKIQLETYGKGLI